MARKTPGQRQKIETLLTTDNTVKVEGVMLKLARPSVSQTAALFERLRAAVDTDNAGNAQIQEDAAIGVTFGLTTHAVLCCLPELESEEDARDLIVKAGGFTGELARKAMALCGMPLGGADDTDPTST